MPLRCLVSRTKPVPTPRAPGELLNAGGSTRSYSRWYIPAASILMLLSALQFLQSGVAQASCTVTWDCRGNADCGLLMGEQLSHHVVSETNQSACDLKVAAQNAKGGLPVTSCKCVGGGDSGANSTAGGPAAPGHEFDSTINRAIADGLTGKLSPGNAVGFTVLGVLGNALFAPKTTTTAPAPDPAEQERQLAAHQLNDSGIYLLKQKNYPGAANDFQKALAITPNDASISNNLSVARQMQKNAVLAGKNSDALAQLLGTIQQTAGTPNGALNPVNLDSDPGVLDLRNPTGMTVDPATLKQQLDNIFSNSPPTSAQSNPQGAPPQAQDIDKLFESPQSASSPAPGSVNNFNAQCSGAAQGSPAHAACRQQQAVEQVEAKEKQLDQILSPEEKSELKDTPGPTNAASSSGSNNGGGGNQPTAGGQTNFFGSSNSVSPANAGLVNSAPAQTVTIKSTTEAVTSAAKSGAAANSRGIRHGAGGALSSSIFDTRASAAPTAMPINKGASQTPSAVALAAQIPDAAKADPNIHNAINNGLAYYGHLEAMRVAKQHNLDLIQQQIDGGKGDAQSLGRDKRTLQTQLNQNATDEAGAKKQLKDILVQHNYSINANWGDASTPATATQSQSTNGTATTIGSTPQ